MTRFSFVNNRENFILSEIAGTSKGDNTSCLKSLDLDRALIFGMLHHQVDFYHICSQYDHGDKKRPRPEFHLSQNNVYSVIQKHEGKY